MDHALESYRVQANLHLLKPISSTDVSTALEMAHALKVARTGLSVRSGGEEITICPDQLLFAEQQGHYYMLNMVDGRQIRVRGRLNELEESLDRRAFFRCHHSYLINLSFVSNIDSITMPATLYGGQSALIRRGWLIRTRTAWENRCSTLPGQNMAQFPANASISLLLMTLLGIVIIISLGLVFPFTSESNSHAGNTRSIDRWQLTVRDADGAELSGFPQTVNTPIDLHNVEPGWTVTLQSSESVKPGAALYVSTQYAPYQLFVNGTLQERYGQPESRPDFLSDPAPTSSIVLLPAEGDTAQISMEYTVPQHYWGLWAFSAQIGSPDAVRVWLAARVGFTFSFGEVTIALGLVLMLFGTLVRRLESNSGLFTWFGLFCIFMGLWSVGECDLASVLIKRPAVLHIMLYAGLYCLTTPLPISRAS